MVLSATTRKSESHPVALAITWPCTAAIVDADGTPLSAVDVLGPPSGGRVSFGDIDEPAALLDFYFGRGGRQLVLRFDGDSLEGRLETHWEGSQRTWWFELSD
jgi:hypothetical protein